MAFTWNAPWHLFTKTQTSIQKECNFYKNQFTIIKVHNAFSNIYTCMTGNIQQYLNTLGVVKISCVYMGKLWSPLEILTNEKVITVAVYVNHLNTSTQYVLF